MPHLTQIPSEMVFLWQGPLSHSRRRNQLNYCVSLLQPGLTENFCQWNTFSCHRNNICGIFLTLCRMFYVLKTFWERPNLSDHIRKRWFLLDLPPLSSFLPLLHLASRYLHLPEKWTIKINWQLTIENSNREILCKMIVGVSLWPRLREERGFIFQHITIRQHHNYINLSISPQSVWEIISITISSDF